MSAIYRAIYNENFDLRETETGHEIWCYAPESGGWCFSGIILAIQPGAPGYTPLVEVAARILNSTSDQNMWPMW